ncbi:MAG: hypothetical protein K5931_05690 [Lachnospiraceae bacterium]|nr:hypothetical protein [Lachnospiraceae bacterium]
MKGWRKRNFFKAKAGVTLEAAIVLPLFLMGMITLLYIFKIFIFYISVDQALYSESRLLSVKAMDREYIDTKRMKSDIESEMAPSLYEGIDIDCSESLLEDPEILTLKAKYSIKSPFLGFKGLERVIDHELVIHSFTGYDRGLYGGRDKEREDEYVYITENGKVYHLSENCSHIRLKVESISPLELKDARNSNGGRYKACQVCHAKKSDPVLYITKEGDRYHKSLECSGLKRTVIRVRLSDIPDYKLCSRCKGRSD